MAKGTQITIGDMQFSSQAEAKQFYKEILAKYSNKESKIPMKLNEKDFKCVLNLFKLHPSQKEKIQELNGIENVASIHVEMGKHNKYTFWLYGKNEKRVNFSYGKCISGEFNDFPKFQKACRCTVEPQTQKVKKDFFAQHGKNAKCEATQESIVWGTAEVDHHEPCFVEIVENFIAEKNLSDLSAIKYEKTEYGFEFQDKGLAASFASFHEKHAKLRVVDIKFNRGRKRKK